MFQPLTSPLAVSVDGELREIWPVVVQLEIDGRPAPLHFAWDRYHRVLRVDERWAGRRLLGDRAATKRALSLARETLRRAADQASEL
ncbi:MAG: hypothetical protein AAGE52_30670 [Myxococcota bacterium]